MARSFAELKRSSPQQLERLRSLIRPNLGSHKRIKLRSAGCEGSGSLLHNDVAKRHGELLSNDLLKKSKLLTKEEALDRLRFLTVLHSVSPLNKKNVTQSVGKMEAALRRSFEGSGTWLLGAVELEIVNIALLRRIGSLKEDEARKLNVLERISCDDALTDADSAVLIHFHGIVDLGVNSLLREEQLRKRLAKITAWKRSPYQIELKRLYKNQTVLKNLRDIASYMTKGGNDQLRYNAGFGRDLGEDLEAKMWRAGEGRADKGAETVTDERGLTIAEIALLDQLWCELMERKRNGRGYLTSFG